MMADADSLCIGINDVKLFFREAQSAMTQVLIRDGNRTLFLKLGSGSVRL